MNRNEPHVGAVRVELLAEILLDQPLARVAPAEHDVFFQACGDALGGRRSADAVLRRRFARRVFRRRRADARHGLLPKCPAGAHERLDNANCSRLQSWI